MREAGATTAPIPAAMSRTDNNLRIRGSARRADTITRRLVRTMPERIGSSCSTTEAWLAQCLKLAIMAAAAVATVALSIRTSTTLGSRTTTLSESVGHQSLFASSSYKSGGISISHRLSRRTRSGNGRVLEAEEEEDVVSKPLVAYETQLELYLCNPTLVVEGNDAYTVDETRLAEALARIAGLGESTTRDDIKVTIKTGPVDADDDSYMCETDGMLQWHAQVKYGATAAAASKTTPAVMAAQANDYVAYSGEDFKSLLVAYVNDEYATSAETVDLSAADIVVTTLGWIVTFPSESSTQDTQPASDSGGLAVDLAEESDLWAWWVWVIYGALVACCLLPLCCFLCRRRKEDRLGTATEPLATTRRGRKEDGLDKIRGPEWGITDLDFEGDHRTYGDEEMKQEYDAAGRAVEPIAYKSSHRPGHKSISGQAWMQEGGKKSAWASSNSSSRPNGGGQRQDSGVARRFDIDEEGGEGEQARIRGRHPHYSFDARAGGGAARQGRRGGGEAKS